MRVSVFVQGLKIACNCTQIVQMKIAKYAVKTEKCSLKTVLPREIAPFMLSSCVVLRARLSQKFYQDGST